MVRLLQVLPFLVRCWQGADVAEAAAASIETEAVPRRFERRAFLCDGSSEEQKISRRLKAKVNAAARQGFDVALLWRALPEAENLVRRWTKFMPRALGARAAGARVWAKQVYGRLQDNAPGGMATYCLYAHIAAAFVKLRLQPLILAQGGASQQGPGSERIRIPKASWIKRMVRHGGRVAVPEETVHEMLAGITQALLNLGVLRVADQARLAGWPVGGGELTELLETVQAKCLRPSTGCSLRSLELAVTSRLARARRLGALGVNPERFQLKRGDQDVWKPPEVMLQKHRDVQQRLARNSEAPFHLTAFVFGTHGALYKEMTTSWKAAQKHPNALFTIWDDLDMNRQHGSYSGVFHGKSPVWMLEERAGINYSAPFHTYLLPLSAYVGMSQMLRGWLKNPAPGHVAVLVCTIPAILCAAYASLSLPVIHYAPTSLTVQVALETVGPFLQLYAKMMKEPKNHFVTLTRGYESMNEALLGKRMRVIPTMGLHINASYVGRRSKQILVFDRVTSAIYQGLSAVAPANFPFTFNHHGDTDKSFKTFARHYAAVFVPGGWTQMSFWDLYAMALPVFVPSDPSRYLWPPLPIAKELQGRVRGTWGTAFAYDWKYADPRQRHMAKGGVRDDLCAHWRGEHRMKYWIAYVNITIHNCTDGFVNIFLSDLSETMAGRVKLKRLQSMDERGHTHWVVPLQEDWKGAEGWSPYFMGGRCMRISSMMGHLVVSLGPPRGMCGLLDAEGGCAIVPMRCPGAFWADVNYLDGPPPTPFNTPQLATDDRFDGAERAAFGEAFWYLGRTVLSPRRRSIPRGDPFKLSSHMALRELAPRLDMFNYPGVNHFVSFADLAKQAMSMKAQETSRTMAAFMKQRRAAALTAWAAVLNEVVTDPGQESIKAKDIGIDALPTIFTL
eukprot:TRINITY_DN11212_c0_g2_i1.p1 TRINITY_DN11212_c0_g2~~TRINITY_DN11212_c0_g2_i1.p1  ORF type:complete len:902 (+),score=167.60 TRINITY_DN11212_c0_g2_i1:175-2880(+)